MGLGPTLVGGVIGAVVGVGLHLLVETTTSFEAPWFAIIIGALTGLGVKQANKALAGRVSYLRGAVAAAIALAAIVGSPMVIAKAVTKDNTVAPQVVRQDRAQEIAADDDQQTEDAAPNKSGDQQEMQGPGARGAAGNVSARTTMARPGEFSMWQFVFMAVGTFIAYEFGRGTAKAAPPAEPVVMTDPSN